LFRGRQSLAVRFPPSPGLSATLSPRRGGEGPAECQRASARAVHHRPSPAAPPRWPPLPQHDLRSTEPRWPRERVGVRATWPLSSSCLSHSPDLSLHSLSLHSLGLRPRGEGEGAAWFFGLTHRAHAKRVAAAGCDSNPLPAAGPGRSRSFVCPFARLSSDAGPAERTQRSTPPPPCLWTRADGVLGWTPSGRGPGRTTFPAHPIGCLHTQAQRSEHSGPPPRHPGCGPSRSVFCGCTPSGRPRPATADS
jgi:hypothetical protein